MLFLKCVKSRTQLLHKNSNLHITITIFFIIREKGNSFVLSYSSVSFIIYPSWFILTSKSRNEAFILELFYFFDSNSGGEISLNFFPKSELLFLALSFLIVLTNVSAFCKLLFLVCSIHLDSHVKRNKLTLKDAGLESIEMSIVWQNVIFSTI